MACVIYFKLYPVQDSAVDLTLMKSLLRYVGSLSVFTQIIASEGLLLIKVVRREKHFLCLFFSKKIQQNLLRSVIMDSPVRIFLLTLLCYLLLTNKTCFSFSCNLLRLSFIDAEVLTSRQGSCISILTKTFSKYTRPKWFFYCEIEVTKSIIRTLMVQYFLLAIFRIKSKCSWLTG